MKGVYPLNDLINFESIKRNLIAGFVVLNENSSIILRWVIKRIKPATDVPSTTCVGYSLFSS